MTPLLVREKLFAIDIASVEPETSVPDPFTLLSGSPVHRTWNLEDDGQGLFAGVWESSPGEWRIAYTEWEFCHVLAGVSVLTDEDGKARTFRAGDSFVIRPGFRGTWRVVETTRKHYVIKA